MTEEPIPTVVTQHPSTDPLVLTAPLNTPMAFDTLLNNSSVIAGLVARITALENAASEAPSTASEGGSHERHRNHTARPGSGHRHS